MRRLASLAVVAAWVVMVAALVRKHTAPPAPALAALPSAAVTERDEWFRVVRDGRQVGWAHRTLARTDAGLVVAEDSVLAVTMLGDRQTLRTGLVAETDTDFALRRFRFTLVSAAAVFEASGTSDGRRLAVTYGAGAERQELTLPLHEPIHLPSTLRPRVLAGGTTPGTRYTLPVLNPLTLRHEPLTVTVVGHETLPGSDGPVDTIRLDEEHEGLRARVWLAPDGGVVREEGTLGFVLERAPRAQALADAATLAAIDLWTTTRVPVEGTIAAPRETRQLTLRVRGEAAAAVPADPPRQRRAGDRLRVTREELPAGPSPPVPAALVPFLASSPLVEADDPAIVTRARAIVDGARDPATAARRLVDWVHAHVEQAPSVTVPSARAVLASARGDCNEHAVLLAALARAAGIPARVAAGVLYVDGGFHYHAWTELWLGAWTSADSTLRQLPADATHVKLLEGGPERHGGLAGLVGKLAFTVEEAER